jgi:hypothetical protein
MYAKIFAQIYDGTLASQGPWQALVTFQQLLILADEEGVVDMTPDAISRRTTLPLEIVQQGIDALSEPDPYSRTPDEGGRRIVLLDEARPWGWRIVNYMKYRQIKRQQDRREYMAQYQRERRNKSSTPVNTRKQCQPIAEAEAKAEAETQEQKPTRKRAGATRKARAGVIEAPDWLPGESWAAFVEHRKAMRAPMTDQAQRLAVAKLGQLREQGHEPGQVIEQSIMRGWRGLFPVESQGKTTGAQPHEARKPMSAVDRVRVATDKWLRDRQRAAAEDDSVVSSQ